LKENLFFRATQSTVQKQGFNSTFLNLILLPLLCIPLFFNASALEKGIPPQDQQAIIYVGENTVVYSTPESSNFIVVKIQNEPVSKNIEPAKKKYVPLEVQVIAKKSSRDHELKVLQQKINKKVKYTFYSATQDRDLLRFAKVRFASAATVNLSFKYQIAFLSVQDSTNIFKIQTTKQKFFASFSYSELGKPRNIFLRGPPRFI